MIIIKDHGYELLATDPQSMHDALLLLRKYARTPKILLKGSELMTTFGIKQTYYRGLPKRLDTLKMYGFLDYSKTDYGYSISINLSTKYYIFIGNNVYDVKVDKNTEANLLQYFSKKLSDCNLLQDSDLGDVWLTNSKELANFKQATPVFVDSDSIYLYIIKKINKKDLQPTDGGVARDKQVVANVSVSSSPDKGKRSTTKTSVKSLSAKQLEPMLETSVVASLKDFTQRYVNAPNTRQDSMPRTELMRALATLSHDDQKKVIAKLESYMANTSEYRKGLTRHIREGLLDDLDSSQEPTKVLKHRFPLDEFGKHDTLQIVFHDNPYSNYSRTYGISDRYDLERPVMSRYYVLGQLVESMGYGTTSFDKLISEYSKKVFEARKLGLKEVDHEFMARVHKFLQVPLPEALQKSTQSGQISLLIDSN